MCDIYYPSAHLEQMREKSIEPPLEEHLPGTTIGKKKVNHT